MENIGTNSTSSLVYILTKTDDNDSYISSEIVDLQGKSATQEQHSCHYRQKQNQEDEDGSEEHEDQNHQEKQKQQLQQLQEYYKKQQELEELQQLQKLQLNQQFDYYYRQQDQKKEQQENQQQGQQQNHQNNIILEVSKEYKDFLESFPEPSKCRDLSEDEIEKIQTYIIKNISYINYCKYKQGHTILYKAVQGNLLPVIKILVENDVNMKQEYDFQYTILHIALLYSNYECFKFLVENADIDTINLQIQNNYTILMTAIFLNCFKKQTKFREYIILLLKRGADINLKRHNETAVHLCIKYCNWNDLNLLIACGADISNISQNILADAIRHAIYYYDLDSIRVLIKDYGVETFSFRKHQSGIIREYIRFSAKCIADNNRMFLEFLFKCGVFQCPLLSITFYGESYKSLKTTEFYKTIIDYGLCEDGFSIVESIYTYGIPKLEFTSNFRWEHMKQ